MLIRIFPNDRLGILKETDAATCAAVAKRPFRSAIGRISEGARTPADMTGFEIVVEDDVPKSAGGF